MAKTTKRTRLLPRSFSLSVGVLVVVLVLILVVVLIAAVVPVVLIAALHRAASFPRFCYRG